MFHLICYCGYEMNKFSVHSEIQNLKLWFTKSFKNKGEFVNCISIRIKSKIFCLNYHLGENKLCTCTISSFIDRSCFLETPGLHKSNAGFPCTSYCSFLVSITIHSLFLSTPGVPKGSVLLALPLRQRNLLRRPHPVLQLFPIPVLLS